MTPRTALAVFLLLTLIIHWNPGNYGLTIEVGRYYVGFHVIPFGNNLVPCIWYAWPPRAGCIVLVGEPM